MEIKVLNDETTDKQAQAAPHRRANEPIKPEYWVLSLSGGKDSTALALEWLARHKADPVEYPLDEVLYCDTGMEFPVMTAHINRLKEIFREAKIKFTCLQPGRSFENLMFDYQPKRRNYELQNLKGKSWPRALMRWCTDDLKRGVIKRYLITLHKQYNVIQLIGIAADEQYRLKRKKIKNLTIDIR